MARLALPTSLVQVAVWSSRAMQALSEQCRLSGIADACSEALQKQRAIVSFTRCKLRVVQAGADAAGRLTFARGVQDRRCCLVCGARARAVSAPVLLSSRCRPRVWAGGWARRCCLRTPFWHAAALPHPPRRSAPVPLARCGRVSRATFRTADGKQRTRRLVSGPGRALFDVAEVALAGASSRGAPRSAQRVLLAALLLLALVVGHAYSGQLLGFLAAPPRLPDPNTLEEGAHY
ncbi:Protein of unknown function [Gryllus bimaculatus]|nr:Protein of unknown function [Gryllus bimaculatus]